MKCRFGVWLTSCIPNKVSEKRILSTSCQSSINNNTQLIIETSVEIRYFNYLEVVLKK